MIEVLDMPAARPAVTQMDEHRQSAGSRQRGLRLRSGFDVHPVHEVITKGVDVIHVLVR
jgi:hypothetical protein